MKQSFRLPLLLILVAVAAIAFMIVRESPDRKNRDKYARLTEIWKGRVDRTTTRMEFCLNQPSDKPYKPVKLNLDFNIGYYDGKTYRLPRSWAEEAESLRKTLESFSQALYASEQSLKYHQRRLIVPY
jgi:hypothetical protein